MDSDDLRIVGVIDQQAPARAPADRRTAAAAARPRLAGEAQRQQRGEARVAQDALDTRRNLDRRTGVVTPQANLAGFERHPETQGVASVEASADAAKPAALGGSVNNEATAPTCAGDALLARRGGSTPIPPRHGISLP